MIVKNSISCSLQPVTIDYEKLIGVRWTKLLGSFLGSKYMINLQCYLNELYKGTTFIYPANINTAFKALRVVDPISVQVVIFADQPYTQANSNGLAFGFNKSKEKTILPLDLTRIIGTLDYTADEFDTSLLSWCEQGVLLLNTSLISEVGGHVNSQMIFRNFIREIVKKLQESSAEIVFVFTSDDQYNYFAKYIDLTFHEVLKYNGIEKNTTMFQDINDKLSESFGLQNLIKW